MKRSKRRLGKKKNHCIHETQEDRVKRMLETGFATAGDLKKEYDLGYNAALKATGEYLVPFVFAAMCCALKAIYKFGCERIVRGVNATIRTMNEEISVDDMLERCKNETGIDIMKHCKEEPLG